MKTNQPKLRFKKLSPNSKTPSYATPGSNGLDITATDVELVNDPLGLNNQVVCKTGIAVEIPEGYVGLLFPRSSVSNKPLSLSNSVGVIDSDYRGELIFKFRYTGNSNVHWTKNAYKVGDRIGQLVLVPSPKVKLEEAYELDKTQRGEGGYGSTGA